MQDVESKRSSIYYNELCVDQEQKVVDGTDFAINFQCNINRLVFNENNQSDHHFV